MTDRPLTPESHYPYDLNIPLADALEAAHEWALMGKHHTALHWRDCEFFPCNAYDRIEAAAIARDREGLVERVARNLHVHCNNSETAAWAKERGFKYGHEFRAHLAEARRLLALDAPEAQAHTPVGIPRSVTVNIEGDIANVVAVTYGDVHLTQDPEDPGTWDAILPEATR